MEKTHKIIYEDGSEIEFELYLHPQTEIILVKYGNDQNGSYIWTVFFNRDIVREKLAYQEDPDVNMVDNALNNFLPRKQIREITKLPTNKIFTGMQKINTEIECVSRGIFLQSVSPFDSRITNFFDVLWKLLEI